MSKPSNSSKQGFLVRYPPGARPWQWWGLVGVCVLVSTLSGCSQLDRTLAGIGVGATVDRREAMQELEEFVFEGAFNGLDPNQREARQQISQALLERFQTEPDTTLRAQILSIAIQGQFDSLEKLLELGARDLEPIVRLTAVQGMYEASPNNMKGLLTEILREDADTFVRIEAAKVMARRGTAAWVTPLVEIILDRAEDQSLRWQAHAAAAVLIEQEMPFVPDRWQEWLEQQRQKS